MKYFIFFIIMAALIGCGHTTLSSGYSQTITCSSCHGSEINAAPPVSLSGATVTTDLEVGAHQAHPECNECHIVPDTVDAPGHVDQLPAEVTWSDFSKTDGLTPMWDRDLATCSNVYCHGSSLSGGTHTSPVWTVVDGTQKTCDSCHGYPPPPPHLQLDDCSLCHANTVSADGTINIAGKMHVNGTVDMTGNACSVCHGSEINAAPPVSVNGISDTSYTEVGAHQTHVNTGSIRKALGCDECHIQPTSVDSPGHTDSLLPAEITWGTLSKTGGLSPSWNRETNTCSNVYCHGTSLNSGLYVTPVWTTVDGSQIGCDGCHGYPPRENHTTETDCHLCHSDTVNADETINVDGGYHINGTVDASGTACNSCHGDAISNAPPVDTSGNSVTTARGVGAHRQHLGTSDWHREIVCSDCHVVPSNVQDTGHTDSALPAELTWSSLAKADSASPTFSTTTFKCSNVYCHGSTLWGTGSNRVPTWTSVGTGQAECGTCHTLPPGPPHEDDNECNECHCRVMESPTSINSLNAHLHINGQVNAECDD